MKEKAFENFKSWKCLIKNQIGKTMKRFKTNNGLEFCSKLLNTCKENDLVERFDKTILERVRCMLLSARVSNVFGLKLLLLLLI